MASSCAFCAIIAGTVPATFVFDEGNGGGGGHRDGAVGATSDRELGGFAAFLDTRPLFKGHTLVVTRRHVETLPDLAVDQVGPLFVHAQRLAAAMEHVLGAAGSFVAVNNRVSQSVPHVHVHVVPRNPKDGLRGFLWPRTRYEDETEMAGYAQRLRVGLGLD